MRLIKTLESITEKIINKFLFTTPCNKCLIKPCCSILCKNATKWSIKYYKIYIVILICLLFICCNLIGLHYFVGNDLIGFLCWLLGWVMLVVFTICLPNPIKFKKILREQIKAKNIEVKI